MADDITSETNSVVSLWRKWPRPDPAPAPVVPVTPEKPADPSLAANIKALLLLRQINFKQLLPVVLTVPTLVFFAISGVIAWLGVLCGFFIRIVRAIAGLFKRK